ncbi:MAG: NUDIX hydrolase [Deltaproteobacteria bacterium]|nr:NUDIX hydrolase [Deltaproteobacteria bacterium]
MTHNPWKTLGTKIVYKNPWISVREDSVICPDGSEGIYGVVDPKIATGVVALTPNREVYLVGQFRYPLQSYSWEIIEGGADGNESPLAAAQRELAEEAGLVASEWSPIGGEMHLSNCFTSERAFAFLAQNLSETKRSPDATEVLTVKCVPFAETLAMIDRGEITDALSIIALLQVARSLA